MKIKLYALRAAAAVLAAMMLVPALASCGSTTPAPTDETTATPVTDDAFTLVRDGVAVCTLVRSEKASTALKNSVAALRSRVEELSGVALPYTEDYVGKGAEEITGARVLLGETAFTNAAVMGDATAYDYAIATDGDDLAALGRTPDGSVDAVEALTAALTVSADGKTVTLPAASTGIFNRSLEPVKHAFEHTTLSFYGVPYNLGYNSSPEGRLADTATFEGVVGFDCDEMPLWATSDVAADIELIEKYDRAGVKIRLYPALPAGFYDHTIEMTDEEITATVQTVIDAYGECTGISHWGYWDEPGTDNYVIVGKVVEAFHALDPLDRPVYVNFGPVEWVDTETITTEAKVDYYCFDRYPFFEIDGVSLMTDKDYIANIESFYDLALDNRRDAGMVFGVNTIGNDPARGYISEEMIKWQTNLLLAYGYRYYEYFTYYYCGDETGRHGTIMGPGNSLTDHYYQCQAQNVYLHAMAAELDAKRLDVVFHLPYEDGSCPNGTTPYYPYRDIGEITGVDALISFYDDGSMLITDRRCDSDDGGAHPVTISGITDGEWFDASSGEWKPLSALPAATPGDGAITLTLAMATQYLIRK